jgi:hypothetical protein
MPDFDTHGPNEPEQPSTLHRFSWVRTIFRSRWDIGLALLNLVLGFAVLVAAIDRFVESPTERLDRMARAQLGQKIPYQPTPEYFENRGDMIDNPKYACKPRVDACSYIDTKATGAKKLAYLTDELNSNWTGGTDVVSVLFYHGLNDRYGPRTIRVNATGYCFYDKDVAVAALRGALDQAELVGKTFDCYVAIYEGNGPDLKPW